MRRAKTTTLVTGQPFSGKTHVAEYLKQRGFFVIDVDSTPGLAHWTDLQGNIAHFPGEHADEVWMYAHQYIWNEQKLRQILHDAPEDVYVFGISDNTFELASLFDRCFYLELTPKILNQRIAQGKRPSPFGRTAEQQEIIRQGINALHHRARKHGFMPIDAGLPLENIKNILTEHAETQ